MKGSKIGLAVLVASLGGRGFAIGRWMGDNLTDNNPPAMNFALPAGIRNSVVRVETGYILPGTQNGVSLFASGVVIDARRDGPDSATGMLCVLTADHDAAFPQGVTDGIFNRRAIFFNDRADGERGIFAGRGMFIRGPGDNDFRADIALLGIRITDWANQVPAMMTPAPLSEQSNDADLVLSGFGRTARIVPADREMVILNGQNDPRPGTYRSGTNRVDAVEEHTTDAGNRLGNQRWRYNSIRSDMDFIGGVGAETGANAHMLNADSGGPSFQMIGETWRLVGSHSESEQTVRGTVTEGARQWDVRLWDQREWIRTNCATLMAPETGTMAGFGIFGVWMLASKRRKG